MNPTNVPPRSSIRVALNLPFHTDYVAENLFRPDAVPFWLSSNSALLPKLASPARLPHAVLGYYGQFEYSTPLRGTVTSLAWPAATVNAGTGHASNDKFFELVVTLNSAPVTSRVTLRLTPRAARAGHRQTCRVRIEHSGLTSVDKVHASVKMWQSALNRIGQLMTMADKSRRRERQAVIVVHGIGEQRPGQLLRQFVTSVFKGQTYFIKPDYVASLFEMSMATVPRKDKTEPTTDVYEFYWAHLIRDTKVTQVYGWMLRLMTSGKHKIPQSLIHLVWGLRIMFVAAVLVIAWLMATDMPGWLTALGLALVTSPALAWTALRIFQNQYIVGYAGDAARYLEPRPENIAVRQTIREAGAELLNALHDKGRYSRIIVYGHSLGSVIAYDILSHAWIQRWRRRGAAKLKTSSRALRALEDLLNPRNKKTAKVSAEKVQSMQHAAWFEYRRNGFEWLVSDFVTAGSPLTHARWLLNLDAKTQFADLVRERSFPTCPPQTEVIASPVPKVNRQVFTFTHAYVVDEQNPRAKRSVQVPHHAGLFALTRWTNLYFPYSGLIDGDPIAGPLAGPLDDPHAGQFGEWVRDVRLKDAKSFAHSRYTDSVLNPEAVEKVRAALNLPFQSPLWLEPTVLP